MFLIIILFATMGVGLMCWYLKVLRNGFGPIVSGSLPIIGHTHKLFGNTEKVWTVLKEISHESLAHGGIARMILAMKTYYVITDPDDLMTVGNACLEKHFAFDFAKPWLGNGLMTAPTPVWKRHRKLINPAFTLQLIHGFLQVFNDQSRKLVEDLKEEAGKGIIDISFYFRENAMKTLSQTVLGLSEEDDGGLFKNYTNAADQLLGLIVERFQNVWLQNDFVYKLLGLRKKQEELIQVLNHMSNAVIAEKRSNMENGTDANISSKVGLKNKAFLDTLLELSADNTLTDKEIMEELDTIINAGTATSSWLITYTCAALGTYPRVQEKVVEELNQVFGDTDRDVNKEDLLMLVYTEAVIKETLRLYPVVPATLRTVQTGIKLKNNYLQPGDYIVASLYGLNRHPVWGPDADQFRPERWLGAETLPHAYGGFGIGKRSCIGKTFAIVSRKTLLVHFLRRYAISGDITELRLKLDFLAKPIAGHHVAISERYPRKPKIGRPA